MNLGCSFELITVVQNVLGFPGRTHKLISENTWAQEWLKKTEAGDFSISICFLAFYAENLATLRFSYIAIA